MNINNYQLNTLRILRKTSATFCCIFFLFFSVDTLHAQLPSNIPSLKLWLRPDTLITVNPGDTSVINWKNIIDTNFVFTIPPSVPSITAPHVIGNSPSINNQPVARFDAPSFNGLESQTPLSLSGNPHTALMFLKVNGTPQVYGHLMCFGSGGGDNWNLRLVSNSGRASFILGSVSADGAGVHGGSPGGNTTNLAMTPNFTFLSGFQDQSIPTGNWFINENFVMKDSSIHLNLAPNPPNPNKVTLGYRFDVTFDYFGHFDVAEIMIFDSTISTSELSDLYTYFRLRYSQSVNLGADYTAPDLCADTLDAGSYFTSYLWNTSDTTQTIVISGPGTYSVQTTDMYGFVSYDTINVSYPAPALPISNILCAGDSLLWNPGLGSGYSYLWSTSETTDSIYIHNSGQYTVTVTDLIACSVSASITVVVDSFPLTASLGPDDSLCAGNTIALISGAAQIQTYLWSDNSTGPSFTVQSSGNVWVNLMDTNGCLASDTINVTIIGVAPIAYFTSSDVCEGALTLFTDSSFSSDTSIINSWLWYFGEPSSGSADTSYLPSPSHLYADSGSYQVTLRVTASSGCYRDTTIIARVYPNPSASFILPNLSCEDSPSLFINTSNTFNYPVQSYSWNFGDPGSGGNNFSSDTNGMHTYLAPGVYIITLTITNIHGCSASFSITDTVRPSANPNFQALTNCYGQPMTFNNLTSGTFQTVFWDFGDNAGSPSPATTIYHLYAYADTFTVTLSTTTNGCIAFETQQVIVHPLPNADFITTPACENSLYTFDDSSWISSGAVTAWQWTFPNSSTSTSQNPTYVFPDALTYPVTLVAISQSGCKDTVTKNILVNPQPVADFGLSVSYGDAPLPENFGNLSSGAISYLWDFGDSSGTSTTFAPSHTYTSRGTYTVTLIATSSNGCSDTTIRYVYVLKPILDIGVTSVNVSNAGNYISVSARVGNFGNLEVLNYKISATLENRLPVFENWSGSLMPGSIPMLYDFNANFEISPGSPPAYVCVEATYPNNTWDENPANNLLCINLSDEFIVVDPYPNPSPGIFNLSVIAPHKERLTVDVFDAGGKLVSNVFSGNVTTGINQFIFDTSVLSEGVYFCRFSFLTKTFVKPLTHIAKEK
jgi:PKD repeat protein